MATVAIITVENFLVLKLELSTQLDAVMDNMWRGDRSFQWLRHRLMSAMSPHTTSHHFTSLHLTSPGVEFEEV